MMQINMSKALRNILILFLTLSLNPLYAQVETDEGKRSSASMNAEDHLQALHTGVLIVRIPTYNAQIKHLSQSLGSSGGESQYLRKQLAKYQEKAVIDKEAIISAFQSEYDFSSVFYIMDSSMHNFMDSYDARYLYLMEGQQVQTFDKEDMYFCIYGNTSQYDRGNKAAWLIMDYRMAQLPFGFPYYVGERSAFQSFMSFFTSIFNKTYKRSMDTIASRFNHDFYKMVSR